MSLHMGRIEDKYTDEKYLRPGRAYKIMKAAQDISKTIYIYGVSGSGKTSFVKEYLGKQVYSYFSAKNLTTSDLKNAVSGREKTILVIDDFQLIPMDDLGKNLRNTIIDIATKKEAWLIISSRCPVPPWLMETYYRQIFLVISEKDLFFDKVELKKYFEMWQLELTEEELSMVARESKGLAMGLKIAAIEICSFMGKDKKVILDTSCIERMRNHFADYLEYHVYNQWDPDIREFFMQVSIVDTFNVRLAEMITCRNDVKKILDTSMQMGNFIIEHLAFTVGDNDTPCTRYEFRNIMKKSMRRMLARDYTKEYRSKLYYNAGMYYQLEGNIPEALKMYEVCENKERIIELLIDNARRHPGSGYYYELKKYYLELPEEKIKSNVELITGMSLLQSILLNVQESERWYCELKKYAEEHRGSDKKLAQSKIMFLDISLPHRGSMGISKMLKSAWELMVRREIALPEFSVTSNLPSMMNGGKDFCQWSRHDKKMASSIGKMVEFALGKYGKGLVNLALAESFLEKGGDSYEILTLANKGYMQAESGGKVEQCFVAVGQLVWLHIINGYKEESQELLDGFYKKAIEDKAMRLLTNIRTMQIRIGLYEGYNVDIIKWLNEEAPDEEKEFCALERYRYMAKVRIYIMIGRYEKAVSLLHKLIYYAEQMHRPYIKMEANLLLSITQYRMGSDLWDHTLQHVLPKLEGYHFVRMISREGSAIRKLLENTQWQPTDLKYWKQVQTETKKMAMEYPSYLKMETECVDLSDTAVKILKLLSQGMTRETVAEKLGFTMANVKYHMNQAYKKLNVKNKAAAVMEAKKHNII